MKVLHLVKTTTGATWALLQMEELVKQGVEVHVVLPSYSGKAPLYEKAGIIVHVIDMDISFRLIWNIIAIFKAFRKLLKEIQPDLIHSHFFSTTIVMRLAMQGLRIPKIFQVPGPLHLEYFFFRWLEIFVSDKNDYWIASCEWTKKEYQSLITDEKRIYLSYYGTDITPFVKSDTAYLRNQLGVPETVKIIGMVAYMYPPKYYIGQKRGLKGHEDLIDAVSIVNNTYNVKLVFIGGAWAGAKRYERSVIDYGKKKLGNDVFFLGTRSDVTKLYSGFDIAVHPSHSENVGGAVESLLMNVPTITSNVGGFPDLIKHKETGLLAEPKNPSDLAEKILFYLEFPQNAHQNSEKGGVLTRYLFDIKRTSKEIKGIYQAILMSPDGI